MFIRILNILIIICCIFNTGCLAIQIAPQAQSPLIPSGLLLNPELERAIKELGPAPNKGEAVANWVARAEIVARQILESTGGKNVVDQFFAQYNRLANVVNLTASGLSANVARSKILEKLFRAAGSRIFIIVIVNPCAGTVEDFVSTTWQLQFICPERGEPQLSD